MTDKEKLEAIRAEIHRLVDIRGYDREMANNLFAFMDSLPNEPVSEDLEEEIKKIKKDYFPNASDPTIPLRSIWIEDIARHFANWQKKKDQKSMEIMDEVYFKSCDMIRKQMIDKACKYLQNHREEVETEDNGISGWISDEFIEDFENYMKG